MRTTPVTKKNDALRVKAKLFRGLSDLSRLAILETLRDGPKNVSEVTRRTGFTQPNVSMHLDCLRCCGLVDRATRGRFVYYSINSKKRIARLLQAAEDILNESYENLDQCSRYEGRGKRL